jgi:ATP-dependent exoDNAse (exonuclease V) alpha subunit
MELTRGQALGLRLALKTREPLLITGFAGTGKTVLVQEIVQQLRRQGRVVRTAAYTGLAAQGVGGTTLARLLGLGISKHYADVDHYWSSRTSSENLHRVTDLIIDEISMISGDYLHMVDAAMQEGKANPRPFGGVRMIFAGDFLQLPAVRGRDEPEFKEAWAFQHPIFQEVLAVQLSRSMRQERKEDVALLNEFRFGHISERGRDFLQQAVGKVLPGATELYPVNLTVRKINEERLADLEGKTCTYRTTFYPSQLRDRMLPLLPIGEEVVLKKGAPVIVRANRPKQGYFNGTQGRITTLEPGRVRIQVPGHGAMWIRPHTWNVSLDGKVQRNPWEEHDEPPGGKHTAVGMPLKLGWAATIHGSQGMTLERVKAALDECWEFGHFYVGTSRTRSLDNFCLVRPVTNILASPEAIAYVRSLPQIEEEV